MLKTYLASNARVDTHRALCKFQLRCLLKKLVGQHPKPFNDFFKIGYVPPELNITLSSESESGLFRLTEFRHIQFYNIPVDYRFADIGTHIFNASLLHFLFYQSLLFLIYEEFYLYRSFTISVIWHKCYPIPVNLSLVRSEKLYSVCWILQFGLEEFRIHFNVLIE